VMCTTMWWKKEENAWRGKRKIKRTKWWSYNNRGKKRNKRWKKN
jgi:hypothetical protein